MVQIGSQVEWTLNGEKMVGKVYGETRIMWKVYCGNKRYNVKKGDAKPKRGRLPKKCQTDNPPKKIEVGDIKSDEKPKPKPKKSRKETSMPEVRAGLKQDPVLKPAGFSEKVIEAGREKEKQVKETAMDFFMRQLEDPNAQLNEFVASAKLKDEEKKKREEEKKRKEEEKEEKRKKDIYGREPIYESKERQKSRESFIASMKKAERLTDTLFYFKHEGESYTYHSDTDEVKRSDSSLGYLTFRYYGKVHKGKFFTPSEFKANVEGTTVEEQERQDAEFLRKVREREKERIRKSIEEDRRRKEEKRLKMERAKEEDIRKTKLAEKKGEDVYYYTIESSWGNLITHQYKKLYSEAIGWVLVERFGREKYRELRYVFRKGQDRDSIEKPTQREMWAYDKEWKSKYVDESKEAEPFFHEGIQYMKVWDEEENYWVLVDENTSELKYFLEGDEWIEVDDDPDDDIR